MKGSEETALKVMHALIEGFLRLIYRILSRWQLLHARSLQALGRAARRSGRQPKIHSILRVVLIENQSFFQAFMAKMLLFPPIPPISRLNKSVVSRHVR